MALGARNPVKGDDLVKTTKSSEPKNSRKSVAAEMNISERSQLRI
jgi:hypothetical protein